MKKLCLSLTLCLLLLVLFSQCHLGNNGSENNITIDANGVSFTMIFVEGGSFTMGCTPEQSSDCNDREEPAHKVTVSDYYIAETEVTQKLWQAVMGSDPAELYNKGCDDCPVENVSWNDCKAFIENLNGLTGKTFRLPTEAEWEFAARGGNKSKGYKYAGSDNIDKVAWYWKNSGDKLLSGEWDWNKAKVNNCNTKPVAQKKPNELGIYDMSGNVWEWCQDLYGSYTSDSKRNPTGAGSGSNRVNRGGGWISNSMPTRVSNRSYLTPTDRDYHLGFRLCVLP
ncbi:MAG: SUMF1/EgtB/PvdO family nonheme iron enzyme [Bernardetiaceae bacterium]|nr:SUMF1/EgtB/PvdO family nonheme iron enzyme [Bernardetiaceae bacterium]